MGLEINGPALPRRDLLKGAGALVIAFGLARCNAPGAQETLAMGPYGPPDDEIDSWLSVNADGTVTLYSGCSELGTGSSTGLLQVAAEELDVPFGMMRLFGPDTNRTPDQFVSSGSRTIARHSRPIRQAAAEARAVLVAMAAKKLGVSADRIETVKGAAVVRDDPAKRVTYAVLVGGKHFATKITGKIAPKAPGAYRVVGQPIKRIDIPDKVFGTFSYVQDIRVPGMLHGRIVRPPANGASVVSVDEDSVAGLPGLVRVVREHDLIGVVCEREEQAIKAAKVLKVEWTKWDGLPAMKDIYTAIRNAPEYPKGYARKPDRPGGVIADDGDVEAGLAKAVKVVKANFASPYHHHGSIGPSCALADVRAEGVTIWSATQTPYGLREACAKFLGLPNEKVRLIYAEGSGCYGQNGADDVVIDAVVLSRAVGKPVRVQWSRADENGWETYKSGRWTECRAGVGADGKIVAWEARTWGFSGYSRPEYHEPRHGGEPGSLVTAQLAGWTKPGVEEGFGGASNNFEPVYADIPNRYIKFTYLGPASQREGPIRLRCGSMRGVGSPDNIFVCESMMDELAAAAGADPLEFRLRHNPTGRMKAVFKAAVDKAGWQARPAHSAPSRGNIATGRGIAALGLGNDTHIVGIFEIEVDRRSGAVHVKRVVVAQDCGLVVNPATVTDQVEGGVIQNISRALKEEVTFDHAHVTSLDWLGYPIIKFPEIPETIEVVLLDHPDHPPMRVGEPASEVVWPALANAIYDAVGVRMRTMPFTPERVRAAMVQKA